MKPLNNICSLRAFQIEVFLRGLNFLIKGRMKDLWLQTLIQIFVSSVKGADFLQQSKTRQIQIIKQLSWNQEHLKL